MGFQVYALRTCAYQTDHALDLEAPGTERFQINKLLNNPKAGTHWSNCTEIISLINLNIVLVLFLVMTMELCRDFKKLLQSNIEFFSWFLLGIALTTRKKLELKVPQPILALDILSFFWVLNFFEWLFEKFYPPPIQRRLVPRPFPNILTNEFSPHTENEFGISESVYPILYTEAKEREAWHSRWWPKSYHPRFPKRSAMKQGNKRDIIREQIDTQAKRAIR